MVDRVLVIKECNGCPHLLVDYNEYDEGMPHTTLQCRKMNYRDLRSNPGSHTINIPDWCPLPKA